MGEGRAIAMSVDPNTSDDVCSFCRHADWALREKKPYSGQRMDKARAARRAAVSALPASATPSDTAALIEAGRAMWRCFAQNSYPDIADINYWHDLFFDGAAIIEKEKGNERAG